MKKFLLIINFILSCHLICTAQWSSCKYDFSYPVKFSDTTIITPSVCSGGLITNSMNCANQVCETGHFILDSNNFPLLTPPLIGRFAIDTAWTLNGNKPHASFLFPDSFFKAGTYKVIVTDANNMHDSINIFIPQAASTLTYSTYTTTINGFNSVVVKNINGGSPPYRFYLFPNIGSFIIKNNLMPGDSVIYKNTTTANSVNIIIEDNCRCENIIGNFNLPSTYANNLDSVSSTQIIIDSIYCQGDSGIYVYSAYDTSTGYFVTDTFVVGIGVNGLLFTDSNNNQTYFNVVIYPPSNVFNATIVNVSNPLCNGGLGSILVNTTGGLAPYINVGTIPLSAGTGSISVTDANGCKVVLNYTITAPAPIVFSVLPAYTISCVANPILFTPVISGGVSPFSYLPTTLTPGFVNTITASDANGCTATTTAFVKLDNLGIKIDSFYWNACASNSIALGVVNAIGGVMPFVGAGQQSVIGGPNYYFKITDANGCTADTTITKTIYNPTIINFQAFKDTVLGTVNSVNAFTIYVVDSTGQVYDSAFTQNFIFNNLASGNYILIVIDSVGCVVTKNFTLSNLLSTRIVGNNILKIFPNPIKDVITIEADIDINSIKIMDVTGKIIDEQIIKNQKHYVMSTHVLCNGYYYLQINNLNPHKIIVQH
jgi:Secretion system C-terminal sorting domain